MNKIISIFFLIVFLAGCMGSGTKLTQQQKIDHDKKLVEHVANNCISLDSSLSRHVIKQWCDKAGYNTIDISLKACQKIMPSYTHYQVGSWPSFVNEIRAVCLFEGERLQNAHSYLATKRIVNASDLNKSNLKKQNDSSYSQTSFEDIVSKSKDICKDLGFVEGTQEMANCSLEIYKTESQIASTEGIQESEDNLNSSLLLLQMGSGLLNANKPKLRCRKTLSGTVSCY